MKPRPPILLSILTACRDMRRYLREYRLCGFRQSEQAALSILSEYRQQWRDYKQRTNPTP